MRERNWGEFVLQWFLYLFPGLARPGVVLGSAVLLAVAALGGVAAWLVAFGLVVPVFVPGVVAVILFWTALSWILYGETVMPAEALAEFDAVHWLLLCVLTIAAIGGALELGEMVLRATMGAAG